MDPIPDEEVESRKIDFKFKKKGVTKLLIFDLDETLAHCVRQEKPERPPDVRLDIKLQSGKTLNAGFNVRPFTHQLLQAVNKHYEVAVFTASHHWYADVILDHIDPKGIYFQHRFYRESCIKTTDNVYVKDLRVFQGIDLKDLMLVDNAVYSFGL
jgi:CTD small phosphatase-like protein 2